MSSAKENVRVVVRARPLNSNDKDEQNITSAFRFDMEHHAVSRLAEKAQGQNELRHDFDAVFDDSAIEDTESPEHILTPYEKQIVFFESHVRPLIDRAIAQGINLTLVTYGQTGAGKTWCIDGDGGDYYNNSSSSPENDDSNNSSSFETKTTSSRNRVEGIVSLAMNRCVSILEPENSSSNDENSNNNNNNNTTTNPSSSSLLPKPSPSKIISSAANPGSNEKSLPTKTASSSGSPGSVVWMRLAVKFVEIYNEKLVDLLAAAVAPRRADDADRLLRLRLRRREDGEDVFFVENLLCFECDSVADAMQWYRRGAEQKTFRSHKMNAHSSRSHCIFTMVVTICSRADDGISLNRRTFEMNFVDLAGSERPDKITQGMDETTNKIDMRKRAKMEKQNQALYSESLHINGSLSTLGRVITALSKGSNHVPFRESKLTSLLRHVLGSNGLLLFIACVSANNVAETTRTLVFASQARTIRVVASPVQDANAILIARLRARVKELEHDLEAALAMNGHHNNINNNNNNNTSNTSGRQSQLGTDRLPASTWDEQVPIGEDNDDNDNSNRKNSKNGGDQNQTELQQSTEENKIRTNDSSNNGNSTTTPSNNNSNKEQVLSQSLFIACTKMQDLLRSNAGLRSEVDKMRNDQEVVSDRLSELERENLNLREKIEILNSVVSVDAKSTESLLRAAVNGNSNHYLFSSPTSHNKNSIYSCRKNQTSSKPTNSSTSGRTKSSSSSNMTTTVSKKPTSSSSAPPTGTLPPLAPSGASPSFHNNNNNITNQNTARTTRSSSQQHQHAVGLPLSLFGQK